MLFNYVIEKVQLGEVEVQSLFRQIVAGLVTAHGLGVAHRDLKLENLLLSRDMKTAKIGDFGLASTAETVSELTDSVLRNTRCGSLSYAAPELLAGLPYDPFLADIWSLGICLAALLFGKIPFQAATPKDQHFVLFGQALSSHQPTILDALQEQRPLSTAAMLTLKACLVPDPTQRASIQNLSQIPWACLGAAPCPAPTVAASPSLAGGSTTPLIRHLGWKIPDLRLEQARSEFQEAIAHAGIIIRTVKPGLYALGAVGAMSASVNWNGKTVKVEWNRNGTCPFQMRDIYQKVRGCFEEIRGHRLASNFKPSDEPESLTTETSSLGKRNASSDTQETRCAKSC